MNRRYCDTGRTECPRIPECKWDCHFDTAKTISIKLAKDIQEAPSEWYWVWQFLVGMMFAATLVALAFMLLAGFYVWTLLL